jgi:hypothetical protein
VLFRSNRSLIIKEKEIHLIQELGLDGNELSETFDVKYDIPRNFADPIIKNLFRSREFWLLESNFEFNLKFSNNFKFNISKAINRIVVNYGQLKIYGSELRLLIPQNTSAVTIYYIVAAWMGQEPNRIRIKICRVGKLVEGIGHVLTSSDFLWDGIYNFEFFEAKISRKRNDMPNLGLIINENVDVVIDLKSVVLHYKMNRFLTLKSVKKIIKNRLLKIYEKSPIFENEVALP